MAEFEDRLRATLRRRAAGVPLVSDVPRGLVRRAELRIARNVSAAALSVTLLAVGVLTGVQALKSPSVERPAAPAPACQAANLQGASDLHAPHNKQWRRVGSLQLTNHGDSQCSLQGRPLVRVLTASSLPEVLAPGELMPLWEKNRRSAPPGWPVVTLRPGDTAKVRVQWDNWCDGDTQPGDPMNWEVQLPGGTSVLIPVTGQDYPACREIADPSTLAEGPFEPYST